MVGRAVGYAEGELRADNELRGMSRKQFIDRLAYHHDQLNTGGSALLGEELIGAHDE